MRILEKKEEIKESNLPFFYPSQGKGAALLIHGFTGNPRNLRKLAQYLSQRGISCYGVRLAGHGSRVENLSETSFRDWQESVRLGFNRLKDEYEKISLVGLSFGGNLAINLAACYPNQIKRLVTIGTPTKIYFERLTKVVVPVAKKFMKYHTKRWVAKIRNITLDEAVAYPIMPLDSLLQFMRFIDQFTKKELRGVTIPTLITHSKRDIVIPPESANYLYQNLGSKQKELHWLEDSYHDPLVDYARDDFFEKIYQFLIKE